MNVTELNENTIAKAEPYKPTKESIDLAHGYLIAEKLTGKLLELGLINADEYEKIMVKNRISFLPELASLYD